MTDTATTVNTLSTRSQGEHPLLSAEGGAHQSSVATGRSLTTAGTTYARIDWE